MKTKTNLVILFLIGSLVLNAQTKEEFATVGLLIKQGHYDEALAICDKYPDDPMALLCKYLNYKEQGKEEIAFKYAKQSAYNGSEMGMVIVGQCFLFGMGTPIDYIQALTFSKRLLKYATNAQYKGLAYLNIGYCYYLLGDINTAAYWINLMKQFCKNATTGELDWINSKANFYNEDYNKIWQMGDKSKTTYSEQDFIEEISAKYGI